MLVYKVRSAQSDFSALQKYICSQDSLMRVGDIYTLELNEKWGEQIYRHSFKLSDAELKSLFCYLEATF